ncbi:MAG: phosphoenolpyruvate synthase [bacterium]|nr:phosphoenolpyruvate synthase [bacterium]
MIRHIIWFDKLGMGDVPLVGGKNASLGEMVSGLKSKGVRVPFGFATTADAYREFIAHNDLAAKIDRELDELDVDDIKALQKAGTAIRAMILAATFPQEFESELASAYERLHELGGSQSSVAVRSSATAEDLPNASFAGQQESYLNVVGLNDVRLAVHEVFASLYNDRAIAYRVHQGFDHKLVALSAGVQHMVRSDLGSSGVMFTLDTESGFRKAVFITAAYGLGETVVQGAVNPDEFYVFKPNLQANRPAILKRVLGKKAIKMIYADKDSADKVLTIDVPMDERQRFSLSDEHVEELARYAVLIEQHYGRPMDIEWVLDGTDQKLYIVQARPETVESRTDSAVSVTYKLRGSSDVLATGRAIGQRIGAGTVRVLSNLEEMDKVKPGDILVTDMTDPDWEPIMKRASGIVTNRGGRTCHAAIIARELGVPAIVGCDNATSTISDGIEATVSCAQGEEGRVYADKLDFEILRADAGEMPKLPVKIMMNVGNPSRAFTFSQMPNEGIGLARLEFMVSNTIGVHPRALIEYDQQDEDLKRQIDAKISGYDGPVSFYVEKLVEGISTLAAAFAGKPVIVRLSDFKSNEYANLLGGKGFEPDEENPMIGFRGASRYIASSFRPCFELECRAVKQVRNEMGLTNLEIMIPFVRTLDEARQVVDLLAENGLKRGENDLRLIMMCEIPSNALLANEFLDYFDGFSIGSNDLTQLTLGLDRDSALVADSFDERNGAVKALMVMAIEACQKQGKYIGICGQGPSDYPDLAEWLANLNISSLSLNPDTVTDTWLHLAKHLKIEA